MGVTPASRPAERSPSGSATPEPRAAVCLNCATPLTGPFCSSCGQRDVPPYPSVRELAIDAFWELSGWDGRFAATVRGLFRRPGMLTREFLEGRRARYISPLRLYLMASLVYFLVAAAAPDVKTDGGKSLFLGVRMTPTAPDTTSRPGRVAAAASDAQNGKLLTAAERDTILAQIQSAPAVMRPFLRRIVSDPAGFKSSLLQAMPKMLFALLPIFALLVSAFYRRRKYPEHLYFAIHLHAFFFLALTLSVATRFTGSPGLSVIAALATFVWIVVYAMLALRRVYGGSIVNTLAKEAGIGMIYSLVAGIAFMLMLTLVSLVG